MAKVYLYLLALSVVSVVSATNALPHCIKAIGDVRTRVASVKAMAPSWERTEAAMKIGGDLRRHVLTIENPGDIDAIAGLLGEDDDGLRFASASVLDWLGPTAGRAVPALEKALADIAPNKGKPEAGLSSGGAICHALKSIKRKKLPEDCKVWQASEP